MDEASLGLYVALQSTGIVEISFDPAKTADESLSVVAVNTDAGFMPGWLTSFGDKIYSISRTGYPDSASQSGGVFAFQKVPGTASATSGPGLSRCDQASSNGKGGVHCEVSEDGKTLVATNITASTLTIYPLSTSGAIGKPTQILDYNKSDPGQKEAHPHQAAFDPSGQYLIVPLRTMDRVDVYSVESPQHVAKVHSISVPVSAGPRHVAFNRTSRTKLYMYLVSEKDNSIRVFTLNYGSTESEELTFEFQQMLSTMGKDLPPSPDDHKDLAAEVAVSNDGKFVYVSNRNLSHAANDALTIYSVDSELAHDDCHLIYLGRQTTHGKHPRMFALSNDEENKFVAVANQFSQDIVVFERDTVTGFLKDVKGRLSVRVAVPHQPTPTRLPSSKT